MEIKKIRGGIKNWQQFQGQFRKIDKDPDIDEADKFKYLVQATIPEPQNQLIVFFSVQ